MPHLYLQRARLHLLHTHTQRALAEAAFARASSALNEAAAMGALSSSSSSSLSLPSTWDMNVMRIVASYLFSPLESSSALDRDDSL